MSRKKKIFFSLATGMVLSGIALYITFKNIPLEDLAAYLKTINYWWTVPTVIVVFTGFVLRVIRWQLLLGPVKKTSFFDAFHPLMIGFSLNCLLPARIGELARPAIFCKKEKVPFSKVLATVGAERVFDVAVLLLFFAVMLATVEINPNLDLTFGKYHLNKATLERVGMTTLKLCLGMLALIVLMIARQSHTVIRRAILQSPKLFFFLSNSFKDNLREGLCTKLVYVFDNFASGFDLLKSPKKLVLCLALSLLVWIFSGLSYYTLAFGCPGIEISFLEMCAVMVILCFFISLPSVPGFWGLWEAGGVFGLMIFGVSAKEAAGFTLANHVFQMVPVIVIGLISLVITGVSVAQLSYDANIEDKAAGGKSLD